MADTKITAEMQSHLHQQNHAKTNRPEQLQLLLTAKNKSQAGRNVDTVMHAVKKTTGSSSLKMKNRILVKKDGHVEKRKNK